MIEVNQRPWNAKGLFNGGGGAVSIYIRVSVLRHHYHNSILFPWRSNLGKADHKRITLLFIRHTQTCFLMLQTLLFHTDDILFHKNGFIYQCKMSYNPVLHWRQAHGKDNKTTSSLRVIFQPRLVINLCNDFYDFLQYMCGKLCQNICKLEWSGSFYTSE